jgi:3-hydroxyacyl-[acyl-carrier-protein] dehydratase
VTDSSRTIDAPLDHPCYAGHFPGNPVVPGVLLLELVVDALGRGAPSAVVSAKFHRVLKPGDRFTVEWKSAESLATFRCLRDSELLAEGTLEFGSTP